MCRWARGWGKNRTVYNTAMTGLLLDSSWGALLLFAGSHRGVGGGWGGVSVHLTLGNTRCGRHCRDIIQVAVFSRSKSGLYNVVTPGSVVLFSLRACSCCRHAWNTTPYVQHSKQRVTRLVRSCPPRGLLQLPAITHGSSGSTDVTTQDSLEQDGAVQAGRRV